MTRKDFGNGITTDRQDSYEIVKIDGKSAGIAFLTDRNGRWIGLKPDPTRSDAWTEKFTDDQDWINTYKSLPSLKAAIETCITAEFVAKVRAERKAAAEQWRATVARYQAEFGCTEEEARDFAGCILGTRNSVEKEIKKIESHEEQFTSLAPENLYVAFSDRGMNALVGAATKGTWTKFLKALDSDNVLESLQQLRRSLTEDHIQASRNVGKRAEHLNEIHDLMREARIRAMAEVLMQIDTIEVYVPEAAAQQTAA